ncbi:hypothetical protein PSM7751_03907 [Pseudooceanicola marinus]|uniref:Uncharacterized protein n=2 Tax=Pseudooceanicola marinus TaxID=396013 RepID=A0A1X7A827_9RHOB|nr:hypothetical protein PSM7751_03907 [Pseudooceanicola marinus]
MVFAFALSLCLALTSVVSAVMMAPDRASHARIVQAVTHGPLFADLCADQALPGHHCPFCHATPEPPASRVPARTYGFIPQDDWQHLKALQRAAQGRNISHSTRAPPRAA